MKHRSSYLPTNIGWVLKIGFAIAGLVLWDWAFVAILAGLWLAFRCLKGVLSCLLYLVIIAAIIILLITIMFNSLSHLQV